MDIEPTTGHGGEIKALMTAHENSIRRTNNLYDKALAELWYLIHIEVILRKQSTGKGDEPYNLAEEFKGKITKKMEEISKVIRITALAKRGIIDDIDLTRRDARETGDIASYFVDVSKTQMKKNEEHTFPILFETLFLIITLYKIEWQPSIQADAVKAWYNFIYNAHLDKKSYTTEAYETTIEAYKDAIETYENKIEGMADTLKKYQDTVPEGGNWQLVDDPDEWKLVDLELVDEEDEEDEEVPAHLGGARRKYKTKRRKTKRRKTKRRKTKRRKTKRR